MMKGLIEFLVSTAPEAQALRDNFVFKIIPILNPDGVINGNYRCSLSGQDLNRRWKNPNKLIHPVIWSVKRFVRQFAKEREVVLYCDLHGHSRRKNIFMYGNDIKETPHATRVFPYILSKLCDFFSFEQSRFSMSKGKEATARISMFKELGIPNIFTLEASFCGADKGVLQGHHFSTDNFMLAGRRLLETIIVYHKINVKTSIKEIKPKAEGAENTPEEAEDEDRTLDLLMALNANDLEKELRSNKQLMKLTTGQEDGESSGSESQPSEDNLDREELSEVVPEVEKKKPEPAKEVKRGQVPPRQGTLRELKPLPKDPKDGSKPGTQPRNVEKVVTRSNKNTANPFERLSLTRKRKPEMKDAWTQTTPRARDERRARRHREARERELMVQYQLQHGSKDGGDAKPGQLAPAGATPSKYEMQKLSEQRGSAVAEGTSPPPQIRIRKEVSSHHKAKLQSANESGSAEATPIGKYYSNPGQLHAGHSRPHAQLGKNTFQAPPSHPHNALAGHKQHIESVGTAISKHPSSMHVVIRANPNQLQDSSKRLPSLASESKSRKLLKAGSPMQNDILMNMKIQAAMPAGNKNNTTVFGQPRVMPIGAIPGQSLNLNRYIPDPRPGFVQATDANGAPLRGTFGVEPGSKASSFVFVSQTTANDSPPLHLNASMIKRS
jgi:hypothetical protein